MREIYRLKSEREVFSCAFFSVTSRDFEVEDERIDNYYVVHPEPGVLVLPITQAKTVIVVEQFRPAIGKHTLEFPAGGIEVDECILDAARRELREETGFDSENFVELGGGFLMPSRMNVTESLVIAKNIYMPSAEIEKEDATTPIEMTVDEFQNAILDGNIQHLPSIALFAMVFGLNRINSKIGII